MMTDEQPLLLFIYWNDTLLAIQDQFKRRPSPPSWQPEPIASLACKQPSRTVAALRREWRLYYTVVSSERGAGERQDELMMRPWASEWGSGTVLPCAVSGTCYSSTRWAGIDDDLQAEAEQAGNHCCILPTWWYCFLPSCYCECKFLFLLSATYFWL
jgi:hypothetical protein